MPFPSEDSPSSEIEEGFPPVSGEFPLGFDHWPGCHLGLPHWLLPPCRKSSTTRGLPASAAGESAWLSLLAACRVHGDVKAGEAAARRLRGFEPEAHVQLWKLYGEGGLPAGIYYV